MDTFNSKFHQNSFKIKPLSNPKLTLAHFSLSLSIFFCSSKIENTSSTTHSLRSHKHSTNQHLPLPFFFDLCSLLLLPISLLAFFRYAQNHASTLLGYSLPSSWNFFFSFCSNFDLKFIPLCS